MQVKQLIGIMNRPWAMEPQAAEHWSKIAHKLFATGELPHTGLPNFDNRSLYQGYADTGYIYRVNEQANIASDGSIQVIKLIGPITKYDLCNSPGSQSIARMLTAAYADKSIKAVLLYTDCPGGQAEGVEEVGNTIKNRNKPVIVYGDSMIASGAYWYSANADEIIVNGECGGHMAVIGSIGAVNYWEDDSKAMEMQGIVRHAVFATKSPDKWDDSRKREAGDYSVITKRLDGILESFHSAVTEGRSGKLKLDKENVLTGKVYNANDALKYGLIDKIGSFDVAVARAVTLAKQQQKNTKMNSNNASFQNALVVAGVEAFEVTDQGFAMSETALNNIDARFAQDAKMIAKLSADNENLSAKVAALESADTTAQIETLTTELTAAKETVSAKETEIAALQADLATAKEAQTATAFVGAAATGDDKAADAEEKVDLSKLAHNKKAEEMGF